MRPTFRLLMATTFVATIVVAGRAEEGAAPIFGIKIPEGFREWKLIAVAHEAGKLNDLRAILGNDIAYKAARDGQLPYPDGSIVARLAWAYVPLVESEQAFGQAQSFVAGAPTNVQFMVKDSVKYAATSGWGFAQFDNGTPASEATHNACFACHDIVKSRDLVFNGFNP